MSETLPLRLSDFDYELPPELIAQNALQKRSEARLLVLNRADGALEHRTFRDIIDYFESGDVLVLNDTKVIPARLIARRRTGGRVEILVLKHAAVIAPQGLSQICHSEPFACHSERSEESGRLEGKLRKESAVVDPSSASPPQDDGACEIPSALPLNPTDSRTEQSRNRSGFGAALPESLPRNDVWEVLIKPSGRVREGEQLILDGDLSARVLDSPDGATGVRHIEFETQESVEAILNRIGRIPLPPYIDREDTPMDRKLYQTVFAKRPGAVASPTAGLHFDEELLKRVEAKGIEILFVTLHVSYGTFQPVTSEDLTRHRMHEEYFEVSDETSERINFAKMDGRRIVACGTTVVRALESCVGANPCVRLDGQTAAPTYGINAIRGITNLFIYPPYPFRIVDRMITNFHLPRTTLLMLTSAFSGRELLMRVYGEAVQKRYRFYSYGDAMLIT